MWETAHLGSTYSESVVWSPGTGLLSRIRQDIHNEQNSVLTIVNVIRALWATRTQSDTSFIAVIFSVIVTQRVSMVSEINVNGPRNQSNGLNNFEHFVKL